MAKTSQGLRLHIPTNRGTRGAWLRRIGLGILLFAAVTAALNDMLGLRGLPAPADFTHLGDGLRLLCNRLFAASESRQFYVYDKLTIGIAEDAYGGAIGAARVLLALVCTGVCSAAVWPRRRWLTPVLFAAAVAGQIYFGVFPSPVRNIALFAVLGLLIVHQTGGRRVWLRLAAAVAAVSLACGLAAAVYPGASPMLYTTSEAARDLFDEKVERPTAEQLLQFAEQRQALRREAALRAANADASDTNTSRDLRTEEDEDFHGAEAGTANPRAPWIAPLTAILLGLALLCWIVYALRQAARRRTRLSSTDGTTAIRHMFALCMDCLFVCGLRQRNVVYAAYAEDVSALFSPAYAAEFSEAAALWREAVYGGHDVTEAQRAQMQAFCVATMAAANARANRLTRVKLALVRFNGGIR